MPQERHDLAVRFTPSMGGAHVAAVAYIKSLEAVLDGLSALRAALAPSIGVARGWSAADVKDAHIFSVGPTGKGSLIVPLVPGAHMRGPHLDVDAIAVNFWERASAELSKVRTQSDIPQRQRCRCVCAGQCRREGRRGEGQSRDAPLARTNLAIHC